MPETYVDRYDVPATNNQLVLYKRSELDSDAWIVKLRVFCGYLMQRSLDTLLCCVGFIIIKLEEVQWGVNALMIIRALPEISLVQRSRVTIALIVEELFFMKRR